MYLWARDPGLCDGPPAAGAGFNDSREEGQITLSPAPAASSTARTISKFEVKVLSAFTGDTQVALSALFARLVESPGHPVATARVLDIERTISPPVWWLPVRYLSALAPRGAPCRARIIADELRREDSRSSAIEAPTSAEISLYHTLYGGLPLRRVRRQHRVVAGAEAAGFALVPPGPRTAAVP